LDEIEAGTALGLMVGEMNVPLITKPGAFGDSRSLIRSLERLRSIRKTGTMA
jgi:4-hydroxythreonine-4-phosphate dehydrogenase